MVGMVMRDEEMGEFPSFFVQFRHDPRGVRRIDAGRFSRPRIVQQDAVIVLKAEELMDFWLVQR
jgi:hypothetical protein